MELANNVPHIHASKMIMNVMVRFVTNFLSYSSMVVAKDVMEISRD